jgi:hypothetical protein
VEKKEKRTVPMFFHAPDPRRESNAQLARQIKTWVAEALHIDGETTLLVTERQCSAPDCPPVETVIAVMETQQPIRQYKLHKPLAEITPEDISALTTVQPKIVGAVEGSQEKEIHS